MELKNILYIYQKYLSLNFKIMKKIIFLLLLFVGMTAFANTSPPDVDVGDKITMVIDGLKTTTVQIESLKHEKRLNAGFKTIEMYVNQVDQGAFLVIKYEFSGSQFVYCSNILSDRYDEDTKLQRRQNQEIKKLKILKPTMAFVKRIDIIYRC